MQLNINNFLSFGEDVHVDIPVGLTLIAGEIDEVSGSSNGAGKSGLLEAITFAIWGKARGTGEYPAGDHLIRDGCNSMSVNLECDRLGVTRRRDGGSSSLAVSLGGVTKHIPTIAVGDGLISNYVGIDFDTFVRTAYFQQGKDKAFSELTSTEARKKVIEILGLEKWSRRQQRPKTEMERLKLPLAVHRDFDAKNSQSDVSRQIEEVILDLDVMEQVLADVQERMNALDIDIEHKRVSIGEVAAEITQAKDLMSTESAIRQKLDDSAKDIEGKRVEKGKLLADIASKAKSLVEYTDTISQYEKELSEKELSETDVKNLEFRLVVLGMQISVLENERDNASVTIGVAEREIKALEDKKEALSVKDVGICPVLAQDCDRISTECLQEAANSINTLILKHVANIKTLQSIKRMTLDAIDDAIADKNTATQSIAKANELLQKINTARASADHATEMLEGLWRNSEAVEQDIDRLVAARVTLVDELDNISLATLRLGDLLAKVKGQEDELAALIQDREQLNTQLVQVLSNKSVQEAAKMALVNKLGDIDKNKQTLQLLEDEYIMWDLLSQAFGPNGVSAMQIDAMKDEVEMLANNILQFGNQGVTVKIQLKEQKKTGEGSKDVFKIIVCNKNDKELPLFRFSGGEGYWVDLAVRAALYLVWRGRNGKSPLDLVMIDEGVGKVDKIKRKVLIDVLKYISTKVSRVLLITHTDVKDMIESFDNMITVYKNNDISTATTIALGYNERSA